MKTLNYKPGLVESYKFHPKFISIRVHKKSRLFFENRPTLPLLPTRSKVLQYPRAKGTVHSRRGPQLPDTVAPADVVVPTVMGCDEGCSISFC
jgi:hypothetical protein